MRDDPAILASDTAYRRVPEAFLDWDGNQERWIPTNASLRDSGGGREISVYLQSFLRSREGPGDVASARPDSVAFSAGVGDARALDFGVTHQPDQDTGPLRHAHGNINGDPGWDKGDYRYRRNALARRMLLVGGNISRRPPA